MPECPECYSTFSRKDNMQRHLRAVHEKNDTIETKKRHNTDNIEDNFVTNRGLLYPYPREPYDFEEPENKRTKVELTSTTDASGRQVYDCSVLMWKHPFTCLMAGPTQSGKSTFTVRLLKYLDEIVDGPIKEIIYCAPKSSYPKLLECIVPVKFLDFIPPAEMFQDKKPRILIIDDMMTECNEDVVNLFTKNSHHLGISVIFICQNIFHRGKFHREISLNSHIIIAFNNPRDRRQISSLACQIYPKKPPYITEIFEDATKEPYGYLLMDLTQTTPEHLRYRTKIFPDDKPANVIYVPKTYLLNI